MKQEYEALFTPFQIGSVEIQNRFVMCPMEGTAVLGWLEKKGYKSEVHDLLVNRAKDGVGLIIPGAVPIYSMIGHKYLWKNPKAFRGVQELMDEIHSYGTKVFFQLSAGLGRNFPIPEMIRDKYKLFNLVMKLDKVTASADAGLPEVWVPGLKTKQMTKEDIALAVEAMAETAYLCKINGVDGIDVHAVHEGYLLDQFAMPYTNHRTDEYGGSLENRLRFACDIVKAIKKRCGEDYPVILRYSVTSRTRGFNQGILPQDTVSKEIGRDFEESKRAIKILTEAGYDGFNADNGTYDAWYYAHPPVYMPLNCNLQDSVAIKAYTDKPVICAGRMQLKESADAIRNGKIDGVGIARQFLTDEEYLLKIREEREEEIRPCISCHIGCMPIGMWKDSGAVADMKQPTGVCALNPSTRNEEKYAVKQAKKPRNIAVIGAGIAGMEFALQASRRGHHVSLYEKSDRLGGVFNEAAVFTFKEKDRDLLKYYETQLNRSSVSVFRNREIRDLSELKADEIVLATGSLAPRNLKVPGGEFAVPAVEYLATNPTEGDNVVIIGGGLTGCEIAYELCLAGKHPVLVEMQKDILMAPGTCMANTNFLRDAFDLYQVPVYTNAKTLSMTEDSVLIETGSGQQKTLAADKIITSIGYVQGTPFGEIKNKHVHLIGDADHVANLMNAIWGANDLAVSLSK